MVLFFWLGNERQPQTERIRRIRKASAKFGLIRLEEKTEKDAMATAM